MAKKIKAEIIIPFRDRGTDPRRGANLDVVMAWWYSHGAEARIVSDGLDGSAPFNRHRAYNAAVEKFPETDVFVFSEADMLIPFDQVEWAIRQAMSHPGLVVPFSQYRYLSDRTTAMPRDSYADWPAEEVEALWGRPAREEGSLFRLETESVMDNKKSIGAVNVVSRATLNATGGFTEATSGNWYDDRIIEEGFAAITEQATRFVDGPAVHLYHLPGWKGNHLSDEDRAATAHNKKLLVGMRADIRMNHVNRVRALMGVRTAP